MRAKRDLRHLCNPVAVLSQELGRSVSRALGHKSQCNTFPVPYARARGNGETLRVRAELSLEAWRGHQQSQGNQTKKVQFLPKQLSGRAVRVMVSLSCRVSVPVESRGGCELPWDAAGGYTWRSPGRGWMGSIQVNQRHGNLRGDSSQTFESHGSYQHLVLCFYMAVGV